jgi:hypothetical protein
MHRQCLYHCLLPWRLIALDPRSLLLTRDRYQIAVQYTAPSTSTVALVQWTLALPSRSASHTVALVTCMPDPAFWLILTVATYLFGRLSAASCSRQVSSTPSVHLSTSECWKGASPMESVMASDMIFSTCAGTTAQTCLIRIYTNAKKWLSGGKAAGWCAPSTPAHASDASCAGLHRCRECMLAALRIHQNAPP